MLNPNQINSVSQLHFSRIQDHNRFPNTDVLYEPLRKVLLRPQQIAPHRQYLNPAASQSHVTRDFAYLTETQVRQMRDHTLIPVDQPLVPTYNLDKVRGNRFMVVDAQQRVVGAPISAQQFQRIRQQGLKQQRIVWDFGAKQQISKVGAAQPPPNVQPQKVYVKPPPIHQTKIIQQQMKTSYRTPAIQDYSSSSSSKKYKYNLFSMLDPQANGHGCGCPGNQIIARRKQPQSLNWL